MYDKVIFQRSMEMGPSGQQGPPGERVCQNTVLVVNVDNKTNIKVNTDNAEK